MENTRISKIIDIFELINKDIKENIEESLKKEKDFSSIIHTDIINITKKLKGILSNENKEILKFFLSSNPVYFQYLIELLKKLIKAYNLDINPLFLKSEGKIEFNKLKLNIKSIENKIESENTQSNIIDIEICNLADNLLKKKYKEIPLPLNFNNEKTFENYINAFIKFVNDTNDKIKTEENGEKKKELLKQQNLIKKFYIDLCIEIQNFISFFIGKKYTRKVIKQNDEQNISINCYDKDLNFVFEQMERLKNNIPTTKKLPENLDIPKKISELKENSSFTNNYSYRPSEVRRINKIIKTENESDKFLPRFVCFNTNDKPTLCYNNDTDRNNLQSFYTDSNFNNTEEWLTKYGNKYYKFYEERIIKKNVELPDLFIDNEGKVKVREELPELKREKVIKCPIEYYPNCFNATEIISIVEDVNYCDFIEKKESNNDSILLWKSRLSDRQDLAVTYDRLNGWIYHGNFTSSEKLKEINQKDLNSKLDEIFLNKTVNKKKNTLQEFEVAETYEEYQKYFKSTMHNHGAFMNGHHVLASEWARKAFNENEDFVDENYFGNDYDGSKLYDADKFAVINLVDTHEGSTHREITNIHMSLRGRSKNFDSKSEDNNIQSVENTDADDKSLDLADMDYEQVKEESKKQMLCVIFDLFDKKNHKCNDLLNGYLTAFNDSFKDIFDKFDLTIEGFNDASSIFFERIEKLENNNAERLSNIDNFKTKFTIAIANLVKYYKIAELQYYGIFKKIKEHYISKNDSKLLADVENGLKNKFGKDTYEKFDKKYALEKPQEQNKK